MFKSSAARSVLPWVRLGKVLCTEDEIAPRVLRDVSLCFECEGQNKCETFIFISVAT